MEVTIRAIHFDLPVRETTESGSDRRCLFTDHRGVRNQNYICFEQLFVVLEKCLQRGRTDLLFAFENKLDVTSHQTFVHQVLKSFCLDHRLAFIVVCTTGIKTAVTDRRLPRIRFPEIKRLYRHYVVMGVDQDSRNNPTLPLPPREGTLIFTIDERIRRLLPLRGRQGWGYHICLLATGCNQQLFPALCALQHIGFMLRLTTHTWDPNETRPLLHKPLTMSIDIRLNRHIRCFCKLISPLVLGGYIPYLCEGRGFIVSYPVSFC